MIYFAEPGPANTKKTLEIAAARVRELGLGHVVVASDTGETTLTLLDLVDASAIRVVSVAEHAGAGGGDGQGLTDARRAKLEARGAKVFVGSHALSGVGRSISTKFKGISHTEIIAYTLRLFGCDGIKVAVEIAVMAADAGLVPTDRELLAIGGTGSGADAPA
jgi:hypothetical protein